MTKLLPPGEKPARIRSRLGFENSRPYIENLVRTGQPRPRSNTAIGTIVTTLIDFDPIWWSDILAIRPDWSVEVVLS